MSRLRRVNYMCSRTVSGTAYRFRHGSTLCSPTGEKILCRSPVSQRSHVGNLRQTIQGKGVIHKRVETAGVYPLVRPRGVSADSARFASAPLPMSTIIKIDKYPQKGYTNLTRGYGGIGRRARFRFWYQTVCRFKSCHPHFFVYK